MSNERPTIPVPYHQPNQDENSDLFAEIEGSVERYLRKKAAKGRFLSAVKKQRLIRALTDRILKTKLTAPTKAQRVKVLKALSKSYTFKELARELSKGAPLAVTQAIQMLTGEGFLVEKDGYSPNDHIELTQKGRTATNEFLSPVRGRVRAQKDVQKDVFLKKKLEEKLGKVIEFLNRTPGRNVQVSELKKVAGTNVETTVTLLGMLPEGYRTITANIGGRPIRRQGHLPVYGVTVPEKVSRLSTENASGSKTRAKLPATPATVMRELKKLIDPSGAVKIWKLRTIFGDNLDEVLLTLHDEGKVALFRNDNLGALTQQEERGAMIVGGQPRHIVYVVSKSKNPILGAKSKESNKEPNEVILVRELEKMKKEAPKDALWSVRQWKKRCLEANRAMTSEEFDAAANRLQRTGRITLHQTENPLDRFDESLVKGGPDRQGLPTRYISVA